MSYPNEAQRQSGQTVSTMSYPLPIEPVCPRCQIEVQPIKAAGQWFCPNCAWQFTEDDVTREVRRQQGDSASGRGDGPTAP